MQTKKIFPLSQDVIAKIAAGEVIERPVYAVKELVENAIDAKATRIAIHITDAGLKHIMVVDNGVGMSREDLLESFKLHTTSKLRTIDDLSQISSLGFRGEALASIAAISNLLIRSRTKQSESGTQIQIAEGKLIDTAPVGMPQGTTVSVSQLFHSVPARKKFLKTKQTEYRHILEMLVHIALANPSIHFTVTHNKKTIFDLPQPTNILERVKFFLGNDTFSAMLPLSAQTHRVTLSGFIGKPQIKTTSANKQFIFINGRSITDKRITKTVKEAYGTLIESKKYPVFVLVLTLPYEFVDVNVHPRKEYVRFADNQTLYETIHNVVNQTLTENNLTFYEDRPFGLALADAKLTSSFAGRILKENQIPWDIRPRNELGKPSEIIQLHNLYLVTQTRFGMMLVDQHAAHERILYEQFLEAFQKQKKESPQYHLPKAALIEFSLSESELVAAHKDLLSNLGFELEHFKSNTFFIESVPLIFQDRNPAELIKELLEDINQDKKIKNIDFLSQKMVAYLACRAAIKAGESLTKKQAKELVEKLEKTNNNATCPHGRPTKITIDIDQLHRMFKRK